MRRRGGAAAAVVAALVSSAAWAAAALAAGAVDPETLPPTLVLPDAGSRVRLPMFLSYQLPEAPLAGSVSMTFDGPGGDTVLTFGDGQDVALLWDGAGTSLPDLVAVAGGPLVDGPYTVTLSYRDQTGNPAASDSAADVEIDTVTDSPNLVEPIAFATRVLPITVDYSLPETALPGSVRLTFAPASGSGADTVLTLVDDSVVSFSWDGAGASVVEIAQAVGPPLADGVYDVSLAYQDDLANPAAAVQMSDVTIFTGATTSTTLAPTSTTSSVTSSTSPASTVPTTTSTTITTIAPATTTTTAPESSTTTTPSHTTTTAGNTTTSTLGATTTTLPAPCGDPFSPNQNAITASDALYVLRASVDLETCDVCLCDIDGSGKTTASDALALLRIAQGLAGTLACPPCAT